MKQQYKNSMILAAMLGLTVPGMAAADPLTVFALFGGNNTQLGNNVKVNSGVVGSNNGVTLGGGSDTLTVTGAGILSGGNSLNIMASGDIVFNGNVTLGGASHATGDIDSSGDVSIGNGAIVDGSIRAGGKVTIGGSAIVHGDIDAGATSGVAVKLGNSADVDGTITRRAGTTTSFGTATHGASVTGIPDAPAQYLTTVLPDATVFSSGGASYVLGGGSVLTLAAGSYNDIDLDSTATLNLSAGTYYFDTWTMNGGLKLNFDLTGGDVQLFFTGNVNIGSNLNVTLTGGDAGDIYAETRGNWTMAGGGEWFGTLFGSGATSNISFGNNTTLQGAAWARHNLSIDGGSDVSFAAADYLQPPTPPDTSAVPEPVTLTLAGAGLAGFVVRRRYARG